MLGRRRAYRSVRNRLAAAPFGPFRQDCTLDVLIRVGRRDDTVPVHLDDGGTIHGAMQLAKWRDVLRHTFMAVRLESTAADSGSD